MRTVVVGGQGFLGGAIVADLLARGDVVTVFDQMADSATCDVMFGPGSVRVARGDIRDPAALQMAFKDAEEVYHLAGVLGTSELEDSVLGAIHVNVIGAVNVFDAAIACRVPVVFFPSKPNVWLNTYTVTKYAAEQFARLYTMHRSVRIPSLRYFNAYGPRQSIVPIRKLVPTFAVQAMKGLPLTVYGEGDQMVDLIFSVDLARLTVDFTRACFDGDPSASWRSRQPSTISSIIRQGCCICLCDAAKSRAPCWLPTAKPWSRSSARGRSRILTSL
jgi:nucleoside-diphosphate-sugar epimerase